MATLTITIPNPILDRVTNGYAYQNGYQDQVPDTPTTTKLNPETKAAFTRRMLLRHIKQAVRQYEIRLAEGTARQTAHDQAESEINLTVT